MIDIKKIAIESQLVYEKDGKLLSGWLEYVDLTEYLEEFAKRIVKECADFVDDAISDGGIDGNILKEHFGVKE